jgi:hypothetical protein
VPHHLAQGAIQKTNLDSASHNQEAVGQRSIASFDTVFGRIASRNANYRFVTILSNADLRSFREKSFTLLHIRPHPIESSVVCTVDSAGV